MRLVKVRRPFPTRKPLRSKQIVDIDGWNYADRYVRSGHLIELSEDEQAAFLAEATPEVMERIRFVPKTRDDEIEVIAENEEDLGIPARGDSTNVEPDGADDEIEVIAESEIDLGVPVDSSPAEEIPGENSVDETSDAAADQNPGDKGETETIESVPTNSGLENTVLPTVGDADLSAAALPQHVTKTAKKKTKSVAGTPADNTESK